MKPKDYKYSPRFGTDDSFRKRVRLLLIIIGVVAVVAGGLLLLNQHRVVHNKAVSLSVTSTTPSLQDVSTQTTSLKITFNQTLVAGSVSVSSTPSIITTTSVSGKVVTLTLTPKTLVSTQRYTILIRNARSTTGHSLVNHTLLFKPNFAEPLFVGEDGLINIGLSSDQVNLLNSYISQYTLWAQEVVVNQSSIVHTKVSWTDDWSPWEVTFSANIDGTAYNIVGEYNDTEHIQVNIYNPQNNALLFTAGTTGDQ